MTKQNTERKSNKLSPLWSSQTQLSEHKLSFEIGS